MIPETRGGKDPPTLALLAVLGLDPVQPGAAGARGGVQVLVALGHAAALAPLARGAVLHALGQLPVDVPLRGPLARLRDLLARGLVGVEHPRRELRGAAVARVPRRGGAVLVAHLVLLHGVVEQRGALSAARGLGLAELGIGPAELAGAARGRRVEHLVAHVDVDETRARRVGSGRLAVLDAVVLGVVGVELVGRGSGRVGAVLALGRAQVVVHPIELGRAAQRGRIVHGGAPVAGRAAAGRGRRSRRAVVEADVVLVVDVPLAGDLGAVAHGHADVLVVPSELGGAAGGGGVVGDDAVAAGDHAAAEGVGRVVAVQDAVALGGVVGVPQAGPRGVGGLASRGPSGAVVGVEVAELGGAAGRGGVEEALG